MLFSLLLEEQKTNKFILTSKENKSLYINLIEADTSLNDDDVNVNAKKIFIALKIFDTAMKIA